MLYPTLNALNVLKMEMLSGHEKTLVLAHGLWLGLSPNHVSMEKPRQHPGSGSSVSLPSRFASEASDHPDI